MLIVFLITNYIFFTLTNYSNYVNCYNHLKINKKNIFLIKESNDITKITEGYDKYIQEKKMKQLKHKIENKAVKQLRITPRIANNDLMIKINAAKKFLLRRHRVKFILTLKGREYTNTENTKKLFSKITEELKSYGLAEPIRQHGNVVSILFNLKAKRKNEKKIIK